LLLLYVSDKLLVLEKALTTSQNWKKKDLETLQLLANSLNAFELTDVLSQLSDTTIIFNLGMILYQKSRVFPAIQCFEYALKIHLDGEQSELYHFLACFYMIIGDFSRSSTMFNKCLQLSVVPPPSVLVNFALLLFNHKHYSQGMDYCTKVLANMTDMHDCTWNYGQVYMRLLPECLQQEILSRGSWWSVSSVALSHFFVLYYSSHVSDTSSLIARHLRDQQWISACSDTDQLMLLGHSFVHLKKNSTGCYLLSKSTRYKLRQTSFS